jgi:hypothetical protein
MEKTKKKKKKKKKKKNKNHVETLPTAVPRVSALSRARATSQHLAHHHRENQRRFGTVPACAGRERGVDSMERLETMGERRN